MDVTSVAEQLLFTTARIETFDSENKPCDVGTGFFFSYIRGDSEKTIIDFLVTNSHIVRSGIKGRLSFLKRGDEPKPILGEKFEMNIAKEKWEAWYCNKDENIDIAILPFSDISQNLILNEQVFFLQIPSDLIPDEEHLQDIGAIADIIFIGYPYGLWDEKNFLPIVRKGITASPVTVDFNGEKKFLIDASVFPGSSGSPVFLYNEGAFSPKMGGLTMGTRILFLGILSEVVWNEIKGKMEYYTEKIKYSTQKKKITQVPISKQLLNIGIVFKSSMIIQTIQEFLPGYQKWKGKFLEIKT